MSDEIDPDVLENFRRAFASGTSGCVRECHCGCVFYSSEPGYTWDEGEYEALEANPKTIALQWSVSDLSFEGKDFVMDCKCWHPRAARLIRFIDAHGREIADFLSREKERLTRIAAQAPVVREST